MTDRIYIKDAAKQLDYKDCRSVRRWCRNHDVGILTDAGCRKKFLIKTEFENARSKSVIKYFSQKYGSDKLPESFNASMNFNTEYSMVQENKHNSNKKGKEYTPKFHHEMRFLYILSTLISEL